MKNKKTVLIVIICIAILLIVGVIIVNSNFDRETSTSNVATSEVTNNTVNDIVETSPVPEVKYDVDVPILCYHGVLDEAWGLKGLFVKVDEFEAQMKYLSENGYTTLFISELPKANLYEKPIVLTFDDGYLDVYTNAYPILQKYNLKANLYIISSYFNGVYMTTDMVKELSKSPLIEIGSHTITHVALSSVTDEEDLEHEIRDSKVALEELTGKNIDILAYPTGAYNDKVLELTKKYYKYGLSTKVGKEDPEDLNTYELRRIYVDRDHTLEQFKKLFED